MKKTEWLVCSAFITKKANEAKDLLLAFLEPKEKQKILELSSPSTDLCLGFDLESSLMESVHYTWFAPFLRSLPEQEIGLFLSAFSKQKAEDLKKMLLFSESASSLSSITKSFLQKKLIETILQDNPELTPIEALPPSSLNTLLTFSSKDLHVLIGFLGLHDLAIEIRQIIDKVKLKKIQSILSKEKVFFLESLSLKKEPVIFKKMELSTWDGNAENLLHLIQKRGMNRLAKALYPEDSDLVWHIKHRMSTEDAALFSALHKKIEQPKAYSFLSIQVTDIISFLKKHKIVSAP